MQISLTALLSLSVLALGAPTPDAAVTVPLPRRHAIKRANGQLDAAAFFANLNHTLQKYKGESIKSYAGANGLLNDVTSILKRQSNEPLTDQYADRVDSLYYGSGTVGSQTFTFDFDTGSSDTFVPGPTCGTAQGCVGTTKYNQQGVDEHNTTSITYGSGSVSGENYYDSVTIAGLTATHQNVISLTQATGFSNSASDGLMGMAFESIANSKQPPYFLTLINEKKVSNPEFSFYLGRGADGTGKNSEMTLGGRDSSKYTGAFTTVPVTKQGYWQVALDEVVVNGFVDPVDTLLTKGQAAIDNGTTLVLAPLLAATSIFARVPGAIPVPLELINGALEPVLYIYPCAATPKVAIDFGRKDFEIAPQDFSLGSLTGDFASIVGNNTLATGDIFLKNWYSTFSYTGSNGAPSVSFAKSI